MEYWRNTSRIKIQEEIERLSHVSETIEISQTGRRDVKDINANIRNNFTNEKLSYHSTFYWQTLS